MIDTDIRIVNYREQTEYRGFRKATRHYAHLGIYGFHVRADGTVVLKKTNSVTWQRAKHVRVKRFFEACREDAKRYADDRGWLFWPKASQYDVVDGDVLTYLDIDAAARMDA